MDEEENEVNHGKNGILKQHTSAALGACLLLLPVSQWQVSSLFYTQIVFLNLQWTENRRTESRRETDTSKCHRTRQSSLEKQEAELYLGIPNIPNKRLHVKHGMI